MAHLRRLPGHVFWSDDISLVASDRLDPARILTSAQVTDSYLLALAASHGDRLATFDRRLSTKGVRGGKDALHIIAARVIAVIAARVRRRAPGQTRRPRGGTTGFAAIGEVSTVSTYSASLSARQLGAPFDAGQMTPTPSEHGRRVPPSTQQLRGRRGPLGVPRLYRGRRPGADRGGVGLVRRRRREPKPRRDATFPVTLRSRRACGRYVRTISRNRKVSR
jgi:hypothetical protein